MSAGAISVVPANEASWDDLQAVFDASDPRRCQCQFFKILDSDWRSHSAAELRSRLREQTHCGEPGSSETSGLVAYLDGEPVGWCAVEPRDAYLRMRKMRTPWTGRDEDKDDHRVWVVTCFVTRKGYRRRGVSYALASAAVDFARERGAEAVEGYPMFTDPGNVTILGELFVGARQVFEEAGFREVSRPSPRRSVMRIDFTG